MVDKSSYPKAAYSKIRASSAESRVSLATPCSNSILHSISLQTAEAVCPHRARDYFLWVDKVLPPVPHWAGSVDILRHKKLAVWITDAPVKRENLGVE